MTYTASEMREMAAINDEKAATCRSTCRPGAAEEYETTAQMLRQAADAMERTFTDREIEYIAAMQDKGER